MTDLKRSSLLFVLMLILSPLANGSDRLGSWWNQMESEARSVGFSLVTVDEVKQLSAKNSDLLIVDVRPSYEFAMGHLPHAVNLEFHLGDRSNLSPQKRSALVSMLGPDKSRRVIIYCRSYS